MARTMACNGQCLRSCNGQGGGGHPAQRDARKTPVGHEVGVWIKLLRLRLPCCFRVKSFPISYAPRNSLLTLYSSILFLTLPYSSLLFLTLPCFLRFTIYDSRLTTRDLRFRNHDSRLTIYESRPTTHDLRLTTYCSRLMHYELRFASYDLRLTTDLRLATYALRIYAFRLTTHDSRLTTHGLRLKYYPPPLSSQPRLFFTPFRPEICRLQHS